MGRTSKEVKVPINGSIYRNSAGNGIIVEADGAQYLPSTSTVSLSSADYPKYVALNSLTPTPLLGSISSNAAKNWGTIVFQPNNYSTAQYNPQGTANAYSTMPFQSRVGKNRFVGMSGTNSTNTIVQHQTGGYRQSYGVPIPAAVFNATTGVMVSMPAPFTIAAWYDSSTSTFRVIGSEQYYNSASLYTSTAGAAWTKSSITYVSVTNTFTTEYFGDQTYYNTGAVRDGLKLYFQLKNNANAGAYSFYKSLNGGATVTEISAAVDLTGNTYYVPCLMSSFCRFAMNYDGTTIFCSTNNAYRYSTNDGVSFSSSTFSGVSATYETTPHGAFSAGDNSSTFMLVFSAATTSNKIYVTTNGGQSFVTYNWTPAATINTSYQQMPGGYDSTNSRWCFVYGTTSGWYAAVSINAGATWTHNLIQNVSSDDSSMGMVFLGSVWYVYGSIGIWKSTDAATWTNVTYNSAATSYSQPYMELTDYVTIGQNVIKKSDFSVTTINNYAVIANASGYQKTFVNYLASDAIIQVQTQRPQYPLFVTSATAATATNYSPYPYSNQQQTAGISPTNIEYWRIK